MVSGHNKSQLEQWSVVTIKVNDVSRVDKIMSSA